MAYYPKDAAAVQQLRTRIEALGLPLLLMRKFIQLIGAIPAELKRVVLKEVVERIVLSGNAIVIDRKGDDDPIVGEVVPRAGVRSSPWRFLDVKWDG